MSISSQNILVCTFVGALLFGGCAPSRAASPPTTLPTGATWLCEIDGGRWCRPCPDCPQEASGFLCCLDGGACLPNVAQNDCFGIYGYCFNYSTSEICTDTGLCTDTATCHDGE